MVTNGADQPAHLRDAVAILFVDHGAGTVTVRCPACGLTANVRARRIAAARE